MIDILQNALGPGLGALGGAFTAWLVFRAKQKDDKQMLIDQLQEERKEAREQAREQAHELANKIDQMYADKHASRRYVGSLVDHIYQRKEPPPPDPPSGYIP